MADEQPTDQTGQNEQQGEPDYKALYEEAKQHARDWEKKAKANRNASKALDEANNKAKSADEKIAELTRRLDEKESAEKRSKLKAKVAQEKGIPVDVIVGDDEESMAAWADLLLKTFKKKPAASVEKPGSFDSGASGDNTELREFAKQLLK